MILNRRNAIRSMLMTGTAVALPSPRLFALGQSGGIDVSPGKYTDHHRRRIDHILGPAISIFPSF